MYILYTIYYILYTIYYILYTIYYILYTIYYILYTIYYILYTIYYIYYIYVYIYTQLRYVILPRGWRTLGFSHQIGHVSCAKPLLRWTSTSTWGKKGQLIHTEYCPPVISWFINSINYSSAAYISAILGAPSCMEVTENGGTPSHHPSHGWPF